MDAPVETAEFSREHFAEEFRTWTRKFTEDQPTTFDYGEGYETPLDPPVGHRMISWSLRDGQDVSINFSDAPRYGTVAYLSVKSSGQETAFNLNEDGKIVDDNDVELPDDSLKEAQKIMKRLSAEKTQADYSEEPSFTDLHETPIEKQTELLTNLVFGTTGEEVQPLTSRLKDAKLTPKHSMQIAEGTTLHLSDAYWSGSHHAVVAYIERDGKVFPYSYYLSGSQGVWRLLPAWKMREGVKWHVKSRNEAQLNLPLPVQKALASLPLASADDTTEMSLFYDIAGGVSEHGEHEDLQEFHGVELVPLPDAFRHTKTMSEVVQPEEADFSSETDPQHPSFSHVLS
jgi:hypothetical protein